MKRIAPAWSLKDLYETNYHPATEGNIVGTVEPLTKHKQLVTEKNEILLYRPYTRKRSTSETNTEETFTSRFCLDIFLESTIDIIT